ncbi:MAG: ABC transporter substrate-binding protein [Streptosporangiales bacterium]
MRLHGSRSRRATTLAAAFAALAVTAAACSGGGGQGQGQGGATGKPVKGGTVSIAEQPGAIPNFIFPMPGLANFSVYNISDLQQLMYRPLYWFGGHNDQPTVDYGLSAAKAPQYKAGGKEIVIKLKPWKWSNGESLSADDVIFWMHMLKAEKANWAAYVPGAFPDNVVKVTKDSDSQVTFKLDDKYSSNWFTYNELSQVTPMPMAWDVTGVGAKPGSGGCTKDQSKCDAVYDFLTKQAKDQNSYVKSKLWSVVDGPWKLSSYSSDGHYSLVPNEKYSGRPKPKLDKIKFLPFTSDSAEFNVLKGGGDIDIGYIPAQDLPKKPASQEVPQNNPAGPHYRLTPRYAWRFVYFPLNFNNPELGPTFRQLYFRQALQMTINQPVAVKSAHRGYAYEQYGPVPPRPKNKWLSAEAKDGKAVYPHNLHKAKKLLTSHGWAMQGGVMTCTSPGTGPGGCGKGVKAGTKLAIDFEYSNGEAAFTQIMQQLQSDASKIGIKLNMSSKPFNSVIGAAVPCKPSQKKCDWQVENWGSWVWAPDYLPTGESLFQTGAGSNAGSYSDPKMDKLIAATEHTNDPQAMYKYENYAMEQLPVIFESDSYTVGAVATDVGGYVHNPLETLVPEYWYKTK